VSSVNYYIRVKCRLYNYAIRPPWKISTAAAVIPHLCERQAVPKLAIALITRRESPVFVLLMCKRESPTFYYNRHCCLNIIICQRKVLVLLLLLLYSTRSGWPAEHRQIVSFCYLLFIIIQNYCWARRAT